MILIWQRSEAGGENRHEVAAMAISWRCKAGSSGFCETRSNLRVYDCSCRPRLQAVMRFLQLTACKKFIAQWIRCTTTRTGFFPPADHKSLSLSHTVLLRVTGAIKPRNCHTRNSSSSSPSPCHAVPNSKSMLRGRSIRSPSRRSGPWSADWKFIRRSRSS